MMNPGQARGLEHQHRYAAGGGEARIGAAESKRAASSSEAGDVELEMWKLGLQIGSNLDVKDTVDKWCEATVTAVDREAARVYVSYTYWAPKVMMSLVRVTSGGDVSSSHVQLQLVPRPCMLDL